jgi:polysaccharide pyruvyl transferase WcaK-like protein
MEFTSQKDSNFFLAICLSIFTFSFMFLGMRMHLFYFAAGFGCLIFAVRYWAKVKKESLPKKIRLNQL